MTAIEIDTPHGPARAHLHKVVDARGALVLGHGAGGGVHAPDLQRVTGAANRAGWSVALVEQPYRVAGRRGAAPAHQLDAAWVAVVGHLRARRLRGIPIVTGGRSSGARVACRTAAQTRAAGVLCLAFPLVPPGVHKPTGGPKPSRLPELEAVPVPVLVIQGERDPFGIPEPGPGRTVAIVAGDHALRGDPAEIARLTTAWLAGR